MLWILQKKVGELKVLVTLETVDFFLFFLFLFFVSFLKSGCKPEKLLLRGASGGDDSGYRAGFLLNDYWFFCFYLILLNILFVIQDVTTGRAGAVLELDFNCQTDTNCALNLTNPFLVIFFF